MSKIPAEQAAALVRFLDHYVVSDRRPVSLNQICDQMYRETRLRIDIRRAVTFAESLGYVVGVDAYRQRNTSRGRYYTVWLKPAGPAVITYFQPLLEKWLAETMEVGTLYIQSELYGRFRREFSNFANASSKLISSNLKSTKFERLKRVVEGKSYRCLRYWGDSQRPLVATTVVAREATAYAIGQRLFPVNPEPRRSTPSPAFSSDVYA